MRGRLPFLVEEDAQSVGASVGISVCPRDGADAMTLIRRSFRQRQWHA